MNNSFVNIKNTVHSFLKENCNSFHEKKFLLAVSGGADSVLLTHIFHSLKLNFSLTHVNYQLRSNESEGDELFVQKLAKSLDVKLYAKGIDTKALKKTKESIQMLARTIRYDYFNQLSNEHAFDYIVLGHHANDQIETVLMNIFRGCGIEGLGGMQNISGKLMRPFLSIERTQIEKALNEKKLKFRTDSSNLKNDYKRNYLRNIVIPAVEKKWPGFEKTMLANIENFAAVKRVVAEKEIDFDFSSPFEITLKTLTSNSLLLNSFKKACSKNGFNIASLSKLLSQRLINESKLLKGKNGCLENKNGKLYYSIFAEKNIDQPTILPKKNKLSIVNLETTFLKNRIEKISLKNIKGKLTLRKWTAGDKMIPLGMNGAKKISDLLTDQKLTAGQKKQVYVLCDDEKPLWLVGFRIDNRVKLSGKESPKEILMIEVT